MSEDAASNQATAGSSQTDAQPMVAANVYVPSVTAGQGIILQPGNANDHRSVVNGDATNGVLIYPPVGSAFNAVAANLPLTLPAQRAAFFVFISPTKITALW